jgi:hypothetical protein
MPNDNAVQPHLHCARASNEVGVVCVYVLVLTRHQLADHLLSRLRTRLLHNMSYDVPQTQVVSSSSGSSGHVKELQEPTNKVPVQLPSVCTNFQDST